MLVSYCCVTSDHKLRSVNKIYREATALQTRSPVSGVTSSHPRCDLTDWNQSVSQAEILSEGSGEENASRFIQVVGRIQSVAGLSL